MTTNRAKEIEAAAEALLEWHTNELSTWQEFIDSSLARCGLTAEDIAKPCAEQEEALQAALDLTTRVEPSESPAGQPAPVRYPLADDQGHRMGTTLRFRLVAKRDDYVAHRTVEDDLYDDIMQREPRIIVGYCTVSTYSDGTPGELFLTIGKEGHELHGWADRWAHLFSMLLQHGVAPQLIYEAIKFQAFEPSGLTNVSGVSFCKSIPDLIVKWMESRFAPTAQMDGAATETEYDELLDSVVEQ